MPNGGLGRALGPGQRERIIRGERTDPRIVIGQAVGFAAVGCGFVLLVMAAIMLNIGTTWKWIGQNWKWLILFPTLPWMIACVLAAIVLFIELFDPNHPNPREATPSTRPNFPWSKERAKPPSAPPRGRGGVRGQIDFTLEGDNDS